MTLNDILSPGKIKNEVILILSKEDLNKNIKNKVIVVKKITLDILPKLYDVKSIIIENGTKLSHISIFTREIGIPMIKIKDATNKNKNKNKINL
jgi:phosphohistidine swiveling domain-containing protein